MIWLAKSQTDRPSTKRQNLSASQVQRYYTTHSWGLYLLFRVPGPCFNESCTVDFWLEFVSMLEPCVACDYEVTALMYDS